MAFVLASSILTRAQISDTCAISFADTIALGSEVPMDSIALLPMDSTLSLSKIPPISPYALPYSVSGKSYDWHRLWINTSVLSGAFVGTLLVLECLPEDATSWNRAELQDVPLFERWYNHVIKKGPEWDHDKIIFNYVLHPYAGAAYFMGARSCGFNFWQSALYGTIVSTVGWEFGIEAFMERPSIQDLFITPVVGSMIGEGFYRAKRWIADRDYRLLGSPVLGTIVTFLVDPVNEFTGLFLGNPARKAAHAKAAEKSLSGKGASLVPSLSRHYKGLTFVATF
ncbi:MAG: DUF3943 domain-containing protein [Sodaliphilus sp.]